MKKDSSIKESWSQLGVETAQNLASIGCDILQIDNKETRLLFFSFITGLTRV